MNPRKAARENLIGAELPAGIFPGLK